MKQAFVRYLAPEWHESKAFKIVARGGHRDFHRALYWLFLFLQNAITKPLKIQHTPSAAIIIPFLLCAYPAFASDVVAITVAPMSIPFLLDDHGDVWAFRKPLSFEGAIKLPNLRGIKKIAPYIAVDAKGQVFTWSLNTVNSRWDETGISKAVYSTPQQVANLQGVTQIAYSGNHFVAVVEDKDIVHWEELHDPRSFRVTGYGAIKTVISRKGVKAVATASRPAIILQTGELYKSTTETLVALFDDGTVMGWGITPIEISQDSASWQGVVLTKVPSATDIAINDAHTIILTADGTPLFFGGCNKYVAKDPNGHPWSSSSVNGYVIDVKSMSVSEGNDNALPDAFIKRDGSVWVAYAPSPSGIYCPALQGDKRQYWQLTAGVAAATQVVGGNPIFMLDADHKLWTTAGSWMNTKFHAIPINLR